MVGPARADVARLGLQTDGMVDGPTWLKLPGGLAEHVARHEQPPALEQPGRRIASELERIGRAGGADRGIGLERCQVFDAREAGRSQPARPTA